jgi:hypothetical protein
MTRHRAGSGAPDNPGDDDEANAATSATLIHCVAFGAHGVEPGDDEAEWRATTVSSPVSDAPSSDPS